MPTTDPSIQWSPTLAKSIDGSHSLAEQLLALRFLEGRGYEFVSITPDAHGPPWNIVFMRQLLHGQPGADLHLVADSAAAPEGARIIWRGAIHIEGMLQQVAACRW